MPGLARMPHKGPMLLLARILASDADSIAAEARDHRPADYPLRLQGLLPPLALVELGAQAAAAHASLHGIGGNHAGLLLSLHEVAVLAPVPDTAPLRVTARRLADLDGAARYGFAVHGPGGPILQGEATLRMQSLP